MIGSTIDDFCLAGAANAFGAGEGNVDAGVEQHVQNGLARGDGKDAPAAVQSHFKAAIRGLIFCHRMPPSPIVRYGA